MRALRPAVTSTPTPLKVGKINDNWGQVRSNALYSRQFVCIRG